MAKITVVIENGKIRVIEDIPVDMYIEVRNRDVAGLDERLVSADESGKPCEVLEWRSPE